MNAEEDEKLYSEQQTAKSDHTTLAHWQLAPASSRALFGWFSGRTSCGLM
jgi:hypothetical protein